MVENLVKTLKDALIASMCTDLKSIILSVVLAVMESALQAERQQIAQIGK